MRGRTSVVPDNGNLRDDLLGVAAALVRVPHPRWFARALAVGGDADLSEIRLDYWRVRADDVAVVFRRAADRGELRADVDPVDAIQMFVGAVLQDPIFTGSPVRPEYVAQLVDARPQGRPGRRGLTAASQIRLPCLTTSRSLTFRPGRPGSSSAISVIGCQPSAGRPLVGGLVHGVGGAASVGVKVIDPPFDM